ncbi:MAG: OsmC family protein [Rhodospirillaceae bacterium]|nr:OsmC family protein [Rhodospirillaceae bacterium]MBT5940121.1 OsmC family protein [Rhodospirillaceae bacterium]
MNGPKPKTMNTVTMGATCPSHARTDLATRDVELVTDEPIARGGTNLGFTPTETFIGSLIACTNVIGNRCAEKNNVELEIVSIDASYDFHFLGAQMKEEVGLPFSEIRLTINVKSDASAKQIAKVSEDLGKYCPVAKMFRQTGCNVVEDWVVI